MKNYKIVSVKKRNPFICFFSINEWRVGVECDGKVKFYNCWASTASPTKDRLVWDLERKLGDGIDAAVGTVITK